MLQRAQGSTLLMAAVVAAGVAALSCGGGLERDTVTAPAPPAAPVAASQDGEIEESAAATRVTVCHYDAVTGTYSTLSVPTSALQSHIRHGDMTGACAASTGTIVGQVFGPPGVVGGAQVRACPSGVATTTDLSTGIYRLESIPAGSVTVKAGHPTYGVGSGTGLLGVGESIQVDISLSGVYAAPTCP